MNRSLARLRKLTHDELTEHTPEELLAMDGLIPLSIAERIFSLNGKAIRNAARFLDEEEQLAELAMVRIRKEGQKTTKPFLILSRISKLFPRFRDGVPAYLSLADHDFLADPEPPAGWYKLTEVLEHYPLIALELETLKASKWYRAQHDLVRLPEALDALE